MFKLKLYLLFLIIFLLILGGVTQRHALACEFIEYSKYSEIAPDVFVSASFDINEKENLLSTIDSAKSRISSTFGMMTSNPKAVVVANKNEASNFGANLFGRAFLTPMGQCIILGPNGQNIDVIAHEYTHAEFHHRVGWLKYMLDVPIWFNEGIALLVDFRKPYLLENINLSQEEINAVKKTKFDFSVKSYQAARASVEHISKAKLYENLEKIKQGQDIENVFMSEN